MADVKYNFIINNAIIHKVCQITTTNLKKLPLELGGTSIGILEDTSGNVIIEGISKNHTGLTVGAKYYYTISGELTTSNFIGKFIGTAISDTKLYIPNDLI